MQDKLAERVVISGLMKGGSVTFASHLYNLQPLHFSDPTNQSIFSCLKSICEGSNVDRVSIEMLCSTAKTMGLENVICTKDSVDFISSCLKHSVDDSELPSFSQKIRFWHAVQTLQEKLNKSGKLIEGLNGDENLLDIVSSVEESIFNYLPELISEDDLVNLADFAQEHIAFIQENPVQSAGIPTGFPKYDAAIGGGYRKGTVNVVGARPKVGKSTFCLNVCKNVSSNGIPVLYLDTEMRKETQAIKFVSLLSRVDQYSIETGQFSEKENLSHAVEEALGKVKSIPFTHANVAGKKPQEILSVARRWMSKCVGKDENGHVKDCLIVLDYLKTMDLGDLGSFQEYQYLGDFITKLHNFSVQYNVPILCTVQLNRDGINREDGSVISGSDRILWLCSSMTFLKKKTDEDVASGDLISNGDRKIIVVDTRYGSGMDTSSEYVNVISNLDHCEMVEGRYNYEVLDDAGSLISNDNDYLEF